MPMTTLTDDSSLLELLNAEPPPPFSTVALQKISGALEKVSFSGNFDDKPLLKAFDCLRSWSRTPEVSQIIPVLGRVYDALLHRDCGHTKTLDFICELLYLIEDMADQEACKLIAGQHFLARLLTLGRAKVSTVKLQRTAMETLSSLIVMSPDNQRIMVEEFTTDWIKLVKHTLPKCGDFFVQASIVEMFYRISKRRSELLDLFEDHHMRDRMCLLHRARRPDFLEECRAFLDHLNQSYGDSRSVYSFLANDIIFDGQHTPLTQEKWVHFGTEHMSCYGAMDPSSMSNGPEIVDMYYKKVTGLQTCSDGSIEFYIQQLPKSMSLKQVTGTDSKSFKLTLYFSSEDLSIIMGNVMPKINYLKRQQRDKGDPKGVNHENSLTTPSFSGSSERGFRKVSVGCDIPLPRRLKLPNLPKSLQDKEKLAENANVEKEAPQWKHQETHSLNSGSMWESVFSSQKTKTPIIERSVIQVANVSSSGYDKHQDGSRKTVDLPLPSTEGCQDKYGQSLMQPAVEEQPALCLSTPTLQHLDRSNPGINGYDKRGTDSALKHIKSFKNGPPLEQAVATTDNVRKVSRRLPLSTHCQRSPECNSGQKYQKKNMQFDQKGVGITGYKNVEASDNEAINKVSSANPLVKDTKESQPICLKSAEINLQQSERCNPRIDSHSKQGTHSVSQQSKGSKSVPSSEQGVATTDKLRKVSKRSPHPSFCQRPSKDTFRRSHCKKNVQSVQKSVGSISDKNGEATDNEAMNKGSSASHLINDKKESQPTGLKSAEAKRTELLREKILSILKDANSPKHDVGAAQLPKLSTSDPIETVSDHINSIAANECATRSLGTRCLHGSEMNALKVSERKSGLIKEDAIKSTFEEAVLDRDVFCFDAVQLGSSTGFLGKVSKDHCADVNIMIDDLLYSPADPANNNLEHMVDDLTSPPADCIRAKLTASHNKLKEKETLRNFENPSQTIHNVTPAVGIDRLLQYDKTSTKSDDTNKSKDTNSDKAVSPAENEDDQSSGPTATACVDLSPNVLASSIHFPKISRKDDRQAPRKRKRAHKVSRQKYFVPSDDNDVDEDNGTAVDREMQLLASLLGKFSKKLKVTADRKAVKIIACTEKKLQEQYEEVEGHIRSDIEKYLALVKNDFSTMYSQLQDEHQEFELTKQKYKDVVSSHIQRFREITSQLDSKHNQLKNIADKQKLGHRRLLGNLNELCDQHVAEAAKKLLHIQKASNDTRVELNKALSKILW